MPRYQRGSVLPLSVAPGQRTDAVPVATISMDEGPVIGVVPVPLAPGPGGPSYRAEFRLPGGISLGNYSVSYAFSIGGVGGSETGHFDVIPGGDSGGEVISLCSRDRPEGRYVLAQIGSGRLVQGLNPHL